MLKVAPSIIAGDQARLGEEVRAVSLAGADLIHIDVMDGHFVPNITLGPDVVKDLRKYSSLPFDCHLMLSEPERYVARFVEAGADRVSVHVEVSGVEEAIAEVKGLGRLAGIALNPETEVAEVPDRLLERADFVVVMTVHPGFYGQTMIFSALDKVQRLRKRIYCLGRDPVVQVDGGVNEENVALVAEAGADEVVAGAFVFKAGDYALAIRRLRLGGGL